VFFKALCLAALTTAVKIIFNRNSKGEEPPVEELLLFVKTNMIAHCKTPQMKWVLLLSGIVLFSCTKKEEVEVVDHLPYVGSLTVRKTKNFSFAGGGYFHFFTFEARFRDTNFPYSKGVYAGKIQCLETDVPLIPNLTMYNTGIPVDSTSLAQIGNLVWKIEGSKKDDVPPFSVRPAFPFSSVDLLHFQSMPVITRNAPFTVSWDNTVPCNAISIIVRGKTPASLTASLPGTASSFTFTAAQTATLDTTAQGGNLHVIAYTEQDTTVVGSGGRTGKISFRKEVWVYTNVGVIN
jgi:hypothetical protein